MLYKNKTNQDFILPNIGFVKAGETIESSVPIENANFEKVEGAPRETPQVAPSQITTPVQEQKKEDKV